MKQLPPYSRIIGLDLHPRRFGYAVLEVNGTPEPFDWGVSRAEGRAKDSAGRRIRRLIDMWQPSFIVVENLPPQRARRVRRLIGFIKKEARRGRVPFCAIDPKWIAQALDSPGKLTKFQQASILAQRFPVLKWKLPEPRGPGASEDYRMDLFDAIVLALAYITKRMGVSPLLPVDHHALKVILRSTVGNHSEEPNVCTQSTDRWQSSGQNSHFWIGQISSPMRRRVFLWMT